VPGTDSGSRAFGLEAVALLEHLPPGRELALAYTNLAMTCATAMRSEEAIGWGERALDLRGAPRRRGEITVHAQIIINGCRADYEQLEQNLERARRAGFSAQVARAYVTIGAISVELAPIPPRAGPGSRYRLLQRTRPRAVPVVPSPIAHAYFDQGRWSEAADSAASVLRIPAHVHNTANHRPRRPCTGPHAAAIPRCGRCWTRHGLWAEPTGELPRLGLVSAARAEAAWLAGRQRGSRGDRGRIRPGRSAAMPVARWGICLLASTRCSDRAEVRVAEPYARVSGDHARPRPVRGPGWMPA
jgi:hypothetical protein